MSDTGEKSVNLTPQQAEALFPGLLRRQTKQTRQHWKNRGVPWDVVGPMMLARSGMPGPTPAQPMHPLSGKSPEVAPERAMTDAKFRKAWRIVGRLWLSAKAAKFKPDHPATKRWQRIAGMLDEFEHVGEMPEPDAEKPWPAAGHPLHH